MRACASSSASRWLRAQNSATKSDFTRLAACGPKPASGRVRTREGKPCAYARFKTQHCAHLVRVHPRPLLLMQRLGVGRKQPVARRRRQLRSAAGRPSAPGILLCLVAQTLPLGGHAGCGRGGAPARGARDELVRQGAGAHHAGCGVLHACRQRHATRASRAQRAANDFEFSTDD